MKPNLYKRVLAKINNMKPYPDHKGKMKVLQLACKDWTWTVNHPKPKTMSYTKNKSEKVLGRNRGWVCPLVDVKSRNLSIKHIQNGKPVTQEIAALMSLIHYKLQKPGKIRNTIQIRAHKSDAHMVWIKEYKQRAGLSEKQVQAKQTRPNFITIDI